MIQAGAEFPRVPPDLPVPPEVLDFLRRLEEATVENFRRLRAGFWRVGGPVASASAITPTGHVFHVTGTTTITSISISEQFNPIVAIFDGALTLTDGGNLKLANSFATSANDTVILANDGTDWYELSRSAN